MGQHMGRPQLEVLGLDHLQLAMPAGKEADARAFYGTLLGLPELEKPAPLKGRGGVWFALGDQALHLGAEEGFRPALRAHPAFRIADLAACRRALAAAGVAVTEDTSVPHVRRFYASDPFGNRLEFIRAGDAF